MTSVNPNWDVPSVTSSTNLGPLTTSISFPANCFTNLYDFQTYGLGAPYTYETQGCALSTCCPYDKFYTNGWGWFSSYYSPAVCPSEYKSCAPYTALVKEPDETAIFCCPQNYDCPSISAGANGYFACGSLLSTATPVTVLDDIFDQRIVSIRTFSLVSTLAASWQIAYPIQIRFKASELTSSGTETWIKPAALVTTTPTTGATPNPGSSPTLTSSPTTTPSRVPSPSRGLSTDAKIGLGVGVGIGVVLLILVFLVGLRLGTRRRQAAARQRDQVPHPATPEWPGLHPGEKAEMEGYATHMPRTELEAQTTVLSQGLRNDRMGELPGS